MTKSKMFIDIFGKKWHAAMVNASNITIEPGDYVLFNEDSGFAFCTSQDFHKIYEIDMENLDDLEKIYDIPLLNQIEVESEKK